MRLLQLLCFCLIASNSYAQEIPISDDSGKAEYKNGAAIAGLTKQKLYDRGVAWINK